MASGIYQIKNDVNGKIYVGKAKNLSTRWQQHKDALKKGKHANKYLQMDYDDMGIDVFTYSILEKVPDCPDLNKVLFQKEREWGDKLDARGKNGYNIANFYKGDKEKLKEAMKVEWNKLDSLRLITYLCYNFPHECVPLYLNIEERVQYDGISGVDSRDDGLTISSLQELALVTNLTQKEVRSFIKLLKEDDLFQVYKNAKDSNELGFCFDEESARFDRNKWIKYF